jgi:hypothetical protein
MRRLQVLGPVMLVCFLVLAGCGGTSSGDSGAHSTATTLSGGNGACVAEVREINGVNTRSFCGSASAQATVNGQTWTWSQGECFNSAGMVGVNIGRVILGTGAAADQLKQQYDYFGVTVSASADGQATGAVTYVYKGNHDSLISATITLSGGLKKGTFSGTGLLNGGTISGSWTC